MLCSATTLSATEQVLEIHIPSTWKSLLVTMGFRDMQAASQRLKGMQTAIVAPKEGGPSRVRGDRQLLDKLLVPRDPRGIVLLCGFIAAAALGASALLYGDPT